ncbi:hypothetical protein [Streptomyces chattanoogensis]|uniref:hypothetical protein n=1 Tax=Streptomyces chattanoogensis TaxID=66876 RepID=UPI0036BFB20F
MREMLYGPMGLEVSALLAIAGDRVHQEGRPPAMNNRINSIMRLTETHWAGAYKEFSISCGAGERDGYTDYTDCADAVPTPCRSWSHP